MNLVHFGAFAREQVGKGLEPLGLRATSADSEEDLASVIEHANVLIIAGPNYTAGVAELVKSAKHLDLIQLTTSGFENLIKFGIPAGTKVANAANAWAVAVAEHAMALMLTLGKQLMYAYTQQQGKRWDTQYAKNTLGFRDTTLLIVGLGRIGYAIAKRAKALDMRVIAAVRTLRTAPDAVDQLIEMSHLAATLPCTDVVIAAVPSAPATYHLFNRALFAQCKRGALFINIARGDVVDTDALYWALETGQLGAAGVDVIDPEPLDAHHHLWDAPNLLITPHVAGLVPAVLQDVCDIVVDNLKRHMHGRPLTHQIQI